MDIQDHFVEFDKYCDKCQYKNVKDNKGEEPCNSCLNETVNENSRKPVNFLLKENKSSKKE